MNELSVFVWASNKIYVQCMMQFIMHTADIFLCVLVFLCVPRGHRPLMGRLVTDQLREEVGVQCVHACSTHTRCVQCMHGMNACICMSERIHAVFLSDLRGARRPLALPLRRELLEPLGCRELSAAAASASRGRSTALRRGEEGRQRS